MVVRLHALADEYPAYGHRRLAAMLAAEGWSVSRRRIERLCRAEGLQASPRRRLNPANGPLPIRASRPDETWCCDLLLDEDRAGRTLTWLAVLDEFTRECHVLQVKRRFAGRDAVAIFDSAIHELARQPASLRTDNGALWRKQTVAAWSRQSDVVLCYTTRGSPWQNGIVESFFGRLRNELLDASDFADVAEAQATSDLWRAIYNEVRPHGALGYLPPQEFRRRWEVAVDGSGLLSS